MLDSGSGAVKANGVLVKASRIAQVAMKSIQVAGFSLLIGAAIGNFAPPFGACPEHGGG